MMLDRKNAARLGAGLLAVALVAGGGGYWLGQRGHFVKVRYAMRYGQTSIASQLDAFKAQFIAVGVDHSEGVLCHLKPVAAKL